MKYLVRLTERAARDMELIYEFIGAESNHQAFAWFKNLAEAIFRLETYPGRGTAISGTKKLRQLFFGKKPDLYRIIYAIDQKNRAVNVLHIRHGARRDWPGASSHKGTEGTEKEQRHD